MDGNKFSWIPNLAPPFEPFSSGPLKVLIVGAGIGGLSAAIALRRAGHNVELFERSKFANESGAAIHLGPSASRVLASYGYSEDRLGAVPCQYVETLGIDGSITHSMDHTSVPKTYDAPWGLCRRADLHVELKHLAIDPEASPGPVCQLHLSHTVIGIDAEKGTLKIRGPWGPVVAHGDLIIGADGIHSIVCSTIFPESCPTLPTGSSAFRFTISAEKLASNPELSRFAPVPERFTMKIVTAEEKRIVIYPCRRGELDFVCIHPDTAGHSIKGEGGWNARSTVASLTAVYSDFGLIFLRMFKLLSDADVKLWQLKDRGPIETWIRGNVCLLGDACHPVMPHPYLGQGGSQAIEDGAALGVLFPLGIAPADVPGRLKLYQYVRKARAESIQEFSRNFMMGEKTSMEDLPQIHVFIHGHDVIAYAKQSMTAIFIPRAEPPKRMQVPSRGPSRGSSPVPGYRWG